MKSAAAVAAKMSANAQSVWAQCAGIDRTAYIKDRRIYDLVYYRRRAVSVRRELEKLALIDPTGVFTPLGMEVASYLAAQSNGTVSQMDW